MEIDYPSLFLLSIRDARSSSISASTSTQETSRQWHSTGVTDLDEYRAGSSFVNLCYRHPLTGRSNRSNSHPIRRTLIACWRITPRYLRPGPNHPGDQIYIDYMTHLLRSLPLRKRTNNMRQGIVWALALARPQARLLPLASLQQPLVCRTCNVAAIEKMTPDWVEKPCSLGVNRDGHSGAG